MSALMSSVNLPASKQEAPNIYWQCVGDEKRVVVVDNYINEISEGYGMVIDASTCSLELNQMKKNAFGGLLITTTAPMPKSLANRHNIRDNREVASFNTQLLMPNSASQSAAQELGGTEGLETARSNVLGESR